MPISAETKRRRTTALGKWLVNPPVRAALRIGIPLPGTALLETVGRRSGQPRRTPVTDGLEGDVFWIVAEHGRQAAYVKNLIANPRVRIRVGGRWRTGTAELAAEEDPQARLLELRGRPATRLNAHAIKLMGTELAVIRVQLDPR
jgi:deazaflavin-dependent oxidoreductase (nitroreductase family)